MHCETVKFTSAMKAFLNTPLDEREWPTSRLGRYVIN